MPKIECVFYLGDSGWAQLSWLLVRNKTYLLNRLLQILQNQSLTLATPSLLWDSLADRIRECEQAIPSFIINRDSHRIQWKKQLLSSEAFLYPYLKAHSSWTYSSKAVSTPFKLIPRLSLRQNYLYTLPLLFSLFASVVR